MTHIVMLLSNAFRPDPRVLKEALSLAELGYRITIICWDRRAELPAREIADGVNIIRIHDVPSAYGSGWRQLFYLPRFWQRAIRLATDLRPDIVHSHDLDTLYAGRQIKRRLGCKLIYDAHEHYPALMSLYLPGALVHALMWWERWLQKSVDTTITASTVLAQEFTARGVERVVALGNYPNVEAYVKVDRERVQAVRAKIGVSRDELLIGYIAGFSRNRQILPFIEAAALLPHVHFHIWGDGLQRAEVEAAAAQYTNVRYHGWAKSDDLPILFAVVDALYYALRVDYPGAVYNAPNTLTQAMAAERPIIANNVGDLGRIVYETECGILLHETTPRAIADAVLRLAEPELRTRLGANGRRAVIKNYNADQLDHQLCELYRAI